MGWHGKAVVASKHSGRAGKELRNLFCRLAAACAQAALLYACAGMSLRLAAAQTMTTE